MESSSASDLARVEADRLGPDDPTPAMGTRLSPSNGTRPATDRIPRPETIRLRSRLDEVLARLHEKLDNINGDSAVAIARNLSPKATRLARAAFTEAELELEEQADDDPT